MANQTSTPGADQPAADERADEFAEPEARTPKEQAWREWMMVGMGLTALLSVIAMVISLAALGSSNPHTTMMMGQGYGAQVRPAALKTEDVRLVIKSDTEHGKMGPDGKWHDAFLPANFTVHAGDRVTVTVRNYDTMPHSFTSSSLSSSQLINQMIPAGSADSPSTTTFTFIAPSSAGRYSWWCAMPCDPYAMSHVGFMRGYVTVAA